MQARAGSLSSSRRSGATSTDAPQQPPQNAGDPQMRRKLALIGLLAAALVGVLIRNSNMAEEAVEEPGQPGGEANPANASVVMDSSPIRSKPDLPKTDLGSLVHQNPFRSPMFLPPAPPTVSASQPNTTPPVGPDSEPADSESLLKVSAIMVRGGRRLALVDDRVVKEGDHLDSGLRVVAIRDDGVLVRRTPNISQTPDTP